MFKKMITKKIIIGTLALVVLLITYIFPTSLEQTTINESITYVKPNKNTIFLLNNDDIVSRIDKVSLNKDSDILKNITNTINSLIIDSNESKYNPNGFKSIIPKNTKILNLELENKTLKIDFSNDFLQVEEKYEEKMIEALIYSLTEYKEIDNIMLFVDSSILDKLPNSKKTLPNILDRSYGVNKIYELDDIKNSTKTTIYYLSEYDDYKYYIPVTFINNDDKNKVEIIIEKLKSTPNIDTNLMSYLQASTELLDYEIEENVVNMTFNNYIFNEFNENEVLEEVKYTLALSLKDNYNADKMVINVNNEKILNFELNLLE